MVNKGTIEVDDFDTEICTENTTQVKHNNSISDSDDLIHKIIEKLNPMIFNWISIKKKISNENRNIDEFGLEYGASLSVIDEANVLYKRITKIIKDNDKLLREAYDNELTAYPVLSYHVRIILNIEI